MHTLRPFEIEELRRRGLKPISFEAARAEASAHRPAALDGESACGVGAVAHGEDGAPANTPAPSLLGVGGAVCGGVQTRQEA